MVNTNRFQLGVSIGVALIDERQGFSLLMSQADKAMYEATIRNISVLLQYCLGSIAGKTGNTTDLEI